MCPPVCVSVSVCVCVCVCKGASHVCSVATSENIRLHRKCCHKSIPSPIVYQQFNAPVPSFLLSFFLSFFLSIFLSISPISPIYRDLYADFFFCSAAIWRRPSAPADPHQIQTKSINTNSIFQSFKFVKYCCCCCCLKCRVRLL